jgi:hypothetical protein
LSTRKRSIGVDLGQPSQEKPHVENGILVNDATRSMIKGKKIDNGEGSNQTKDVDVNKSRGIKLGLMDDSGRRLGVENSKSNEIKSFSLLKTLK